MKSMRYTLLMAVLFAAAPGVHAQSFKLNPNDSVWDKAEFDDELTLGIRELNISGDTLHLQWKKVSAYLPPEWEARVCDNGDCYPTLLDSGFMSAIIPDAEGFMLVHVMAKTYGGKAIVRYAIWDINHPDKKDTITFMAYAEGPSGIEEKENGLSFGLYPNPAQDHIILQLDDFQKGYIDIFNITGESVFSGMLTGSSRRMDISALASGIYVIRLTAGNAVVRKRLVKE